MWAVLRILLFTALLDLTYSATDPTDFTGSVSILPSTTFQCSKGKTAAQCATCKTVCNNVFQCMGTADLKGKPVGSDSSGDGTFFTFGVMTGTSGDPKCGNFYAAVTRPIKDAANLQDSTPGSLVVSSVTARFRIENPLTLFVDTPTFSDSVIEGNLVAQCDGLTMYFSPGGLCDCTAQFRVESGKVMSVDAAQEVYDPAAGNEPVQLGTVYGLRVKHNLAAEDFHACNSTFMGTHTETGSNGSPFPVQCFRKFIVAESKVTRYNQTVCGTQLHFYNMGQDQSQTTCRDGLGVVTPASDTMGPSISGKPAGVFYHRDPSLIPPTADDGTLDDSEWFFSLTPAKLALNASAQLDLQLTLLTGNADNRTQLTCIAEYKVDTYTDPNGNVISSPILGLAAEPMKSPDSASMIALAWALLLPTLLLLL